MFCDTRYLLYWIATKFFVFVWSRQLYWCAVSISIWRRDRTARLLFQRQARAVSFGPTNYEDCLHRSEWVSEWTFAYRSLHKKPVSTLRVKRSAHSSHSSVICSAKFWIFTLFSFFVFRFIRSVLLLPCWIALWQLALILWTTYNRKWGRFGKISNWSLAILTERTVRRGLRFSRNDRTVKVIKLFIIKHTKNK